MVIILRSRDLGRALQPGAMGGIGSGWHRERKLAVEDCLTLSPAFLLKGRAVADLAYASGTVSWIYPGSDPNASIRYVATLSPEGAGYIRLRYAARGEAMDYLVRLVTTRPNYGGLRWVVPVPSECTARDREAGRQALPPPGRQVLRLPGGPRPHLPIVPRELAIPQPRRPACGSNLMETSMAQAKP